jgi:hypothetical protein
VNYVEATKTVAKSAVAVAIGETHSHEIDTLGFDYASIDVLYSPFTAATTAATAAVVLKLQESDAAGSGQTDVSGFVGGTDFTPGPAVTATASVGYSCRFDVDLRGKKRYLTVATTPVSAVGVVTVCRLARGVEGPVKAAAKGVANAVTG